MRPIRSDARIDGSMLTTLQDWRGGGTYLMGSTEMREDISKRDPSSSWSSNDDDDDDDDDGGHKDKDELEDVASSIDSRSESSSSL